MIVIINGRKAECELMHNSGRQYGDPVDAYVWAGTWDDSGAELTDDELNEINDKCAEEIQHEQHMRNCGA